MWSGFCIFHCELINHWLPSSFCADFLLQLFGMDAYSIFCFRFLWQPVCTPASINQTLIIVSLLLSVVANLTLFALIVINFLHFLTVLPDLVLMLENSAFSINILKYQTKVIFLIFARNRNKLIYDRVKKMFEKNENCRWQHWRKWQAKTGVVATTIKWRI